MRSEPAILLAILLVTTFSGCITQDEGAIALYVRGAPVEGLETLIVRFEEIRLHRAGADADAEDGDGPGWVTVSGGTQEVDLLNFTTASSRALVANTTLATGDHDRIVLEVGAARATTNTSDTPYDLIVAAPELRIEHAFGVSQQRTTQIIITFDLQDSLSEGEDGQTLDLAVSDTTVDEDAGQLQRSVSDRGVPPSRN